MNDLEFITNFYYESSDGESISCFSLAEVSEKFMVSPFLLEHSYLYRYVMVAVETYLLNKKRMMEGDRYYEDKEHYLGLIKEVCEKNNLGLYAVVFSYLKPFSEYEDYQKDEYRNILGTINDFGIKHIDLYRHFSEEDIRAMRQRRYPDDEVHPAEESCPMIAKKILEQLSPFVKKGPAQSPPAQHKDIE
jgi:hypothetical protein